MKPIASHKTRMIAAAVAEIVGTLAIMLWIGGVFALGAFSAPEIFHRLGRDTAGPIMATIFLRFDRMVVVLAALFTVCECVRVACQRPRGRLAGARVALSCALVAIALVSSLRLDPRIWELFVAGVRRGVGEAGAELERLHTFIESLAKTAALLASAWISLGVILRGPQTEADPRQSASPSRTTQREEPTPMTGERHGYEYSGR